MAIFNNFWQLSFGPLYDIFGKTKFGELFGNQKKKKKTYQIGNGEKIIRPLNGIYFNSCS